MGLEHEFYIVRKADADSDTVSPVDVLRSKNLIDVLAQKKRSDPGFGDDDNDVFCARKTEWYRVVPYVWLEQITNEKNRRKESERAADAREKEDAEFKKLCRLHPLLHMVYDEPLLLALPNLLPFPADVGRSTRVTVDDVSSSICPRFVDAYQRARRRWMLHVLAPLLFLLPSTTTSASRSDRDLNEDDARLSESITDIRFLESSAVFISEKVNRLVNRTMRSSSQFMDESYKLAKLLTKSLRSKNNKNTPDANVIRRHASHIFQDYLVDAGIQMRYGDVVIVVCSHKDEYGMRGYPTPPKFVLSSFAKPASPRPSPENVVNIIREYFRKNYKNFLVAFSRDAYYNWEYPPEESGSSSELVKAVSLDGDFVEVKSTAFARETVGSIVDQVRRAEDVLLEVATKCDRRRSTGTTPVIFPYSGFSDMSSSLFPLAPPDDPKKEGQELVACETFEPDLPQYAGSFHVWVTLPHERSKFQHSTKERERLARTHAIMAHRLQWIEPMLLSVMSGDPRALGNGLRYPRASMRSMLNPLSGFGTTDPTSLLHLEVTHLPADVRSAVIDVRVGGVYYDNIHDARRDVKQQKVKERSSSSSLVPATGATTPPNSIARRFDSNDFVLGGGGGKKNDHGKKKKPRLLLWVKVGGEWTLDRICIDTGRVNNDNWENQLELSTLFDSNIYLSPKLPETMYQTRLREAGAAYHLHSNNDIRVQGCGRVLSRALLPGWRPVWVRLPGPPPPSKMAARLTGNVKNEFHLALHFVNTNKKNRLGHDVTDDAPVDKASIKKSSAIGFEFRVMDNCPTSDMTHVLRLFALIAASAVHDEKHMYDGNTNAVFDALRKYRAGTDTHWSESLTKVSTLGCFAPLSPAYTRKVYDQLGLCVDNTDKNDELNAAYDKLLLLCDDLHRAYGKDKTALTLQGASATGGRKEKKGAGIAMDVAVPPRPVNRNFEAWKTALRQRFPISSDIEQVKHLFKRLRNDDAKAKGDGADAASTDRRRRSHRTRTVSPPLSVAWGDVAEWEADVYYLMRLFD